MYDRLQRSTHWHGEILTIDCTHYLETLSQDYSFAQKQTHGQLYHEWLPNAAIGTLQLWSQAEELLTLQNACKLTDNGNITVKNLTNWRRVRVGVASFHFALPPTTNIKRQRAELLATTIVANYPHTVMEPQYAAEVRLTAHPKDHPATVTLQLRPMIEAVIYTSSYGPDHSVQGAGGGLAQGNTTKHGLPSRPTAEE
ncbi:hypothetical protein GN244_ATG20724 [Phytophthora infestans]|uniref:Uncharacterized protein n=1 Tax=Phytophthora infestans TaxID=4787 RepID=A0A833SD21_PHYIN|nr:hypothetical protein GN244_ATG20724 [Phytophthora infestans]